MTTKPDPASNTNAPSPIVGIDLGTTNSLVAIADAHGPRILPSPDHHRLIPSIVRYTPDGAPEAIGVSARAHAIDHPTRTIHSIKRLMGRSLADAADDLPHLSYRVVEGPHHTVRIALDPDDPATSSQAADDQRRAKPIAASPTAPHPPALISPQQVSADILRALKDQATAALGTPVSRAVVTVPAYFDDAQRQATRDAGRLAGLDIVRIVNEPTAAALAYGIGLSESGRPTRPETVAVFDLGGGTFDISILQVTPPEENEHDNDHAENPGDANAFFQVIATHGDTHLGGDDIDQMLAQIVLDALEQQLGRPADLPPRQRQALRTMAERAKIALSTDESTTLAIDADLEDDEHIRWSRTITRAEFNELITPWLDRAIASCQRALRDAKLTPADIDRVVMVGGSTRIPLVRQRVAELFNTEPYTALNPDEVVALGAAVQASILAGSTRGMLLLDVVPLSLGIETVGGAVAKLIMRNTSVPARATEMFSTSVDNQTGIKLHILQGEREMVEHCRSLGTFELKGIPPMPAGMPQLEVEFFVDANGVLDVRAHERRSGKRATLQIVPNHGLTREEVDHMEAESFAHAREDMQRHRIADLIANSRLDAKWIGEGLAKVGALLEPDARTQLEAALQRLRNLIAEAERNWKSVDPNEFHRAKEELDRRSVRMHEIAIAQSLRDESLRDDDLRDDE
ncbi:MAG: Hsp70 family protein [Phycisphaerales bacterium]